MMDLGPTTKVARLLEEHPHLLDFLADYAPGFDKLRNPLLRKTLGRAATLEMAAGMGRVDVKRLLADIRREIEQHSATAESAGEHAGPAPRGGTADESAQRKEILKGIIRELHRGGDVASLQARFTELAAGVSADEISALEQELIEEGMPPEEVQRLCDLHVRIFESALDQLAIPDVPPGHPIHTFLLENAALARAGGELRNLVATLGDAPDAGALADKRQALQEALNRVGEVETHYARKENQLFPFLEKRGLTGPPQVMWGKHDEVRALLKTVRRKLAEGDAQGFVEAVPPVLHGIEDMRTKEEKILFPMSLEMLDDEVWGEIRRGEAEIGYALVVPAADWTPRTAAGPEEKIVSTPERLTLDTGSLSLEQINLVLNHLPVELSFVDENDEVRFYSGGPDRIFPRSPGVIGRKVQNCHPAKSLHMVNRILEEFRAGKKDHADFWITMDDRFLFIRYFAIRDGGGTYRGCLEVTQDVTEIRKLEGEQRLLDWES
jgi:DUF438 domain-containing protein